MTRILPLFLLSLSFLSCKPAEKHPFSYAYAPTTFYENGTYYSFYCSTGEGAAWDFIRLTTSTDGVTWGASRVVLQPTAYQRAACDPSVVKFNNRYYMAFSGNIKDIQTVNFMAVSDTPEGPYTSISDTPITYPRFPNADGPGAPYGAGQPSLVSKGDYVIMWYTEASSIDEPNRIYMSTSKDMLNWSPAVPTNLTDVASVDVKWDINNKRYVLYCADNQHSASAILTVRYSQDGLQWTDPTFIATRPFANNVGAVGTPEGYLYNDWFLYAQGAVFGQFNLYRLSDTVTTLIIQPADYY